MGCGVGLTTTTRGKTESANIGVDGRHTVGNETAGSVTGSTLSRECCSAGGNRRDGIALWGNMSTINVPTDGLDLGGPKEMLKHELGDGDGVGGFSDDE